MPSILQCRIYSDLQASVVRVPSVDAYSDMVVKAIDEVLASSKDRLPATNSGLQVKKALIEEHDRSNHSKAALIPRTNKIIKAYHGIQRDQPHTISDCRPR
jgi:hypothetical protein